MIPHAAQGPRSRSAAIPRPSVPPARKAGSPVRRYRRELVLRHEPLSLALGNLTELMVAAWENDPRWVRRLLDVGQARLQADHGYSALMLAVRNRSIDVVFLLAGRETGLQSDHGKTATMLAVEAGSDDVLNLLAGREPGCQDRWGTTALMHATLLGRLDAAERLAPYDAGRSDREGRTALIMASYCGHSRLLPRLAAEIGLGGFTSLMYSAALTDTAGMQQAWRWPGSASRQPPLDRPSCRGTTMGRECPRRAGRA